MIVQRSAFLLLILAIFLGNNQVQGGYWSNHYSNTNNNNNDDDNDDANQQGDDAAGNTDDAAVVDDYVAQNGNSNGDDDWLASNKNVDDDLFHWSENTGFSGVSIMPVSCVNYNNGHFIKFAFFQSSSSKSQCRRDEIGTFVVSIAHYMRAYFNYQALAYGEDFQLPSDAGYLNCVELQSNQNSDQTLYAKIGCKERETFTSTRLALKLYTDNTCSEPYDDGKTSHYHSNRGYLVDGHFVSSKVSFRPPFYNCAGCEPEAISDTFNKWKASWYDDDYISEHGERQDGDDDDDDEEEEDKNQDDFFNDDFADDAYADDFNNQYYYSKSNNNNRDRNLAEDESTENNLVRARPAPLQLVAKKDQLDAFAIGFWEDIKSQQRKLYDNNYDIGEWNMCQRVYKYGLWCDEDCRSIDQFRTDLWSGPDIMLLAMMCTFLGGMMLLVTAKRLKAVQKSKRYNLRSSRIPGLPPLVMFILFCVIMLIIAIMAGMNYVNETLVFAVVICLLLFIYLLKVTLFEDTKTPVLLAAPNSEWDFDNKLDQRLF